LIARAVRVMSASWLPLLISAAVVVPPGDHEIIGIWRCESAALSILNDEIDHGR
jgi:hypothetical protein